MGLRDVIARWVAPSLYKQVEALTRPVYASSSQVGRPIYSDWNTANAIEYGLKASVWVYAALRRIVVNTSRLPLYVEQLADDNKTWERVVGHPLEILLNEPNPFMSGQDLRERSTYHLWLGGNSIAKLVLVRGVPLEIWPIQPDRCKPVPHQTEFISEYIYTDPNGREHSFPANEVIHHQFVDPANPYWGLSPIQAASRIIDTDVAAVNWNITAMQNRTVKDLIYFPDRPLETKQWQEARKQLREQHMGPDNARGIFLASMPGNVQQVGATAVELDWLNSRKYTREEISAAIGLPLIILVGEGTFRNFETAERVAWRDVYIPYMDDYVEGLNRTLVPYWDPESVQPGVQARLRITYDISNIEALQEDFGKKVEIADKLLKAGYTLNQVNQRLELGFDDVPWGDQPLATLATGLAHDRGPIRVKAIPMSEFQKAEYWKQRDNTRRQWEQKIARIIADQFEKEGKLVEREYIARGEVGAKEAVDKMASEWQGMFEGIYETLIEQFGSERYSELEQRAKAKGINIIEKKLFSTSHQWIRLWMRRIAARKVTHVSDTTKQRLAERIAEMVRENEPTGVIAREIRNIYNIWAGIETAMEVSRSYTIARTETGTAMNYAEHEGARQAREDLNLIMTKSWISSRDDRVRETHIEIDGETVPFERPFSNGMQYPMDPDGEAGEVINCRCVMIENVE